MRGFYAIGLGAALAIAMVDLVHADETRDAIASMRGTEVLHVHAVGAQIYECKAGAAGTLSWQFREPVAALLKGGQTVGRHFAGPSWETTDGSMVTGKVDAKAPGASPGDIPWLALHVSERRGEGVLKDVTSVLRIDTIGGQKTGTCSEAGAFAAEPYAADYIFSKP